MDLVLGQDTNVRGEYKRVCLDSCYKKKWLYKRVAMFSSSTFLSPFNSYTASIKMEEKLENSVMNVIINKTVPGS